MSRIKEQIVQSIDFINKNIIDKDGVTKPFEPDNAYLLKNGVATHDRYVTDHLSNISLQNGDVYSTSEIDGFLGNKADLIGGLVPSSQLPVFVDEILEFADLSQFPLVGDTNKYYLDLSTNKTYRWTGSNYIPINEGIAIGETSSTAYRGDRGKTAYDHSQLTTSNPHGTTASDIGSYTILQADSLFASKVNKEVGKGLSQENYTTLEKSKLASIQSEQLDHGIIFNKTLATTQTINSATPVDLTPLICGGVTPLNEGSPFYYDALNNLIRCSNLTQKYFSINIILLLSGTITSGGSGDTFLVTLHRPNDAIFRSFLYNSELTTETFVSKQVCVINSFVQSGGNDNFQLPVGATTGGFRIKISRVNGNTTMTLDSTNTQSIRLLS